MKSKILFNDFILFLTFSYTICSISITLKNETDVVCNLFDIWKVWQNALIKFFLNCQAAEAKGWVFNMFVFLQLIITYHFSDLIFELLTPFTWRS